MTIDVDVDILEGPLAAVKESTFKSQTLKLDVVVIVHFFPNYLHLDVRMETEYATLTVLPLKIHL